MALMVISGLLVVAGLIAIVRWGHLDVEVPPSDDDDPEDSPSWRVLVRRYVWGVAVAVVAGLGSGVLAAGAGGRLAMRLLAATAGDAAQGRVTEADEVVGRISADGTIGFIIFTALIFGTATGALYLLVRRWLPRGRLGGLAYGGLLLVLAGSRLDPLRSDNPDFDIVGPGWLSVLIFAAVVLVHGMLVAALAGRFSRALPLLSRRRRAVLLHAPVLLLAPAVSVLLVVILVGVIAVLAARARPLVQALRSDKVAVGGRIVLAALALVALPGFLSSVTDILGRGP